MERKLDTNDPVYYCYNSRCEWEGDHPVMDDFFAKCPKCGGDLAVKLNPKDLTDENLHQEGR